MAELGLLADQTEALGTPSPAAAEQLEGYVVIINRLTDHERQQKKKSGSKGRKTSKPAKARQARAPK